MTITAHTASTKQRWSGFKALLILAIILLIPATVLAIAIAAVAIKTDNFSGEIQRVPAAVDDELSQYAMHQQTALQKSGTFDDAYEVASIQGIETCISATDYNRTITATDGRDFYTVGVTSTSDDEPYVIKNGGAGDAWNDCAGTRIPTASSYTVLDMFTEAMFGDGEGSRSEPIM